MKKMFSAIAIAGAMVAAGSASATELWDTHLPGSDEGLAAGALPPPGVYGILDSYLATNYSAYSTGGKVVPNTNLTALVEVPIVLWSTGIKIFGADYAVAIAQPFDFTSAGEGYGFTTPSKYIAGTSGNWGTYNTVLIPGQLSWTFGDFHVKTGLSIYVADASSTVADVWKGTFNNRGAPSGVGYWAIQPDLGLSWLHEGWNLSASMHLPIPVSSTSGGGVNYRSGAIFEADYTATKTIGKWTLGVGGYQVNQLNTDTLNGKNAHNIDIRYGLGPIVGYQFGGVNLQATLNQSVYTQNSVGGMFINVRAIVPF